MKASDILQQVAPWREACRRLAWKPITEAGDGEIMASKFSGMPWLAADEPYPCCGNCHAPMPLFLQLNLAELPDELAGRFGQGLLQLFYCTGETCGHYAAFSNEQLARVVQPQGQGRRLQADEFPSLPPSTIVGWQPVEDYPNYQDYEELGLLYDFDIFADPVKSVTLHCPMLGLDHAVLPLNEGEQEPEAEDLSAAAVGDKLAGYPHWVQGTEYPHCPLCDRRMELVFQLDSHDHLAYMFGDAGIGHLTQCPEHQTILTFAWACS